MRVRYLPGLLAIYALPTSLAAQGSCPALQAGSTVRLHAPSAATYTLPQAVHPADSVIVLPAAAGSARVIRCADLQRVQLRTGTDSPTRSALRGAWRGLLVGSVVGGAIGYLGASVDDGGFYRFAPGDLAVMGGAVFGGAGAVVGGAIGASAPRRHWREVPVVTHPPRAPAEGLRIGSPGRSQVSVSCTLSF
jgi:hypothetical protein